MSLDLYNRPGSGRRSPGAASRRDMFSQPDERGHSCTSTPDQHQLTFLQGDTRHAGNSSDVIARRQIAEVLISSLTSAAAAARTFDLVAEHGPAQTDLHPLFAYLDKDPPGSLDGVRDAGNMPDDREPQRIRDDLQQRRNQHQ